MINFLQPSPSISVKEFEKKFEQIEGFAIFLRCGSMKKIPNYNYQKAAPKSWRLSELLEKRIKQFTDDIEIVILNPDLKPAHSGMKLGTFRKLFK